MRTLLYVLAATTLLALPVRAEQAAQSLHEEGQHWSYDGQEGPDHWGELGYPLCKSGGRQSPIAIDKDASFNDEGLQTDYQSTPLNAVHNGHTVQFDVEAGNVLILGGNRYELKQFHLHAPAEHTLAGQTFPMELHLVHRSLDAELAVVGILIQAAPQGVEPSPALETVLASLPGRVNLRLKSEERLKPGELLPANTSYYRYSGSLTTPPCSEDVRWYVLKEPLLASEQGIARFRTIFDHNARPVRGKEESSSSSASGLSGLTGSKE